MKPTPPTTFASTVNPAPQAAGTEGAASTAIQPAASPQVAATQVAEAEAQRAALNAEMTQQAQAQQHQQQQNQMDLQLKQMDLQAKAAELQKPQAGTAPMMAATAKTLTQQLKSVRQIAGKSAMNGKLAPLQVTKLAAHIADFYARTAQIAAWRMRKAAAPPVPSPLGATPKTDHRVEEWKQNPSGNEGFLENVGQVLLTPEQKRSRDMLRHPQINNPDVWNPENPDVAQYFDQGTRDWYNQGGKEIWKDTWAQQHARLQEAADNSYMSQDRHVQTEAAADALRQNVNDWFPRFDMSNAAPETQQALESVRKAAPGTSGRFGAQLGYWGNQLKNFGKNTVNSLVDSVAAPVSMVAGGGFELFANPSQAFQERSNISQRQAGGYIDSVRADAERMNTQTPRFAWETAKGLGEGVLGYYGGKFVGRRPGLTALTAPAFATLDGMNQGRDAQILDAQAQGRELAPSVAPEPAPTPTPAAPAPEPAYQESLAQVMQSLSNLQGAPPPVAQPSYAPALGYGYGGW